MWAKFRSASPDPVRLDWCRIVAFSAVWLVSGALTPRASADVFKYVDTDGNIYFSDEPLPGDHLRLESKRTSTRLAAENKGQSERERRRQEEAMARVQARLEAHSVSSSDWRPSAPVSGSLSIRRERYRDLIEANASRYGLSPELVHAVIRAESAYQANALSHAGACGLMQLMPGTAARFGVRNTWDPAENIRGGSAYLRFLLDLFDGDVRLALAGYNAGEDAVRKHDYQIPPYPETRDYVRKVLRHLAAERSAHSS
jgi:soluble lytic murein transglycosylase-like protein